MPSVPTTTEIPELIFSAETFDYVNEYGFTRVVPRDELADVERMQEVELDAVAYLVEAVDEESVTLLRRYPLPCSVPFCVGHVDGEADSFDKLMHTGDDVAIADLAGLVRRASFGAAPTLQAGVKSLNISILVEGDLSLDDVERFAKALEAAPARLREAAATLAAIEVTADGH